MTAIPHPTDYHPPLFSRIFLSYLLTYFIMTAIPCGIITFLLTFLTPPYLNVLRAHRKALPFLSRMLLDVSDASRAGLWVVGFVVALAMALLPALLTPRLPSPRAALVPLVYSTCIVVITCGGLLLIVYAYFLALSALSGIVV